MSDILHHRPPRLAGLCLDNEGYTSISDLLRVIKTWKYGGLILAIVRLDPKGRFEVTGDKIRAVYGHSYTTTPHYPLASKPGILYHGTQLDKLSYICVTA